MGKIKKLWDFFIGKFNVMSGNLKGAVVRTHHGLFSRPEALEKVIFFMLTVIPGILMGIGDIFMKSLRFYGLHSEPASDFLRNFHGFSNFVFHLALIIYPIIGWTLYRLLTMKSTGESKNDLYFPFLVFAGFYILASYCLVFTELHIMVAGAFLLSFAGGVILSVKLYKINKLTFAVHTFSLPIVLLMTVMTFLF